MIKSCLKGLVNPLLICVVRNAGFTVSCVDICPFRRKEEDLEGLPLEHTTYGVYSGDSCRAARNKDVKSSNKSRNDGV